MSTATHVSTFSPDIDIFALSARNKALLMERCVPILAQQQQQPQQPQCGLVQERTRHPSWASSTSSSSSSGGRPSPTSMMISYDTAPGSPMDTCRDRSSPSQQQQQQIQHPGAPGQPPVHRRLDRSLSEPADRQSKTLGGSVNGGRYKTELCRPYEENGYCKYGDKCQFAHGEGELRSLARHPKYKTELCRTFHTIGFCPYGPRCHFIHNEDERRLSQISHMKQQQVAQVVLHQQHQVAAQQQQQQPGRQVSPPTPITQQQQVRRPTNFTLSLPSLVRDALGSTADSPPASITGSPTMSPVSFASDELVSMPPPPSASFAPQLSSTPPASAPAGVGATFTFPDYSSLNTAAMLPPLDMSTVSDPIASLAAGLQAARLAHKAGHFTVPELTDDHVFNLPPSPPESLDGDSVDQPVVGICESPLDVSRSLRLPVFSQLAIGAQN